MKILQLDVEKLAYDVLKPEASVYEETKEKHAEFDDALVMWVCVEKGDTNETADAALKDALAFMDQIGRKKLVVYPFAHLSSNLAEPKEAMSILDHMYKSVPKGIKASKAPFGWTKKFTIEMKGHPLAEQAKSYDSAGKGKKTYKKTKPASVNTAIVKKSDWAGLPENDHRTIGERLDLYSFQEVSPGMTYWHPNGYIIYKELFKYIREKLDEYGYQEIATPAFANIALWQVSGHYDHYKDNMFILESDGQEFGLKPMNCPSTIMIFKSRRWSYRDLPVRFADFDKLYRNEISGALTGLLRVRELTQDDAHLFVREDQVEHELVSVLKMVDELYKIFGLKYIAKLSTMPDDHMGDAKLWDKATSALENALKANKMKYETKEKEGAFYGPKIDFDVQDSQGRLWQCATVQLDYQLPQRFKLEYTGEDGRQHTPVIIHRVIYGSLERFIAILVEHYQGKFPTWLAPVQVKVISISDQSNEYAHKVYEQLRKARIRAEEDLGDRTMEYKLREAIEQKVPYMLVVGKKEVDANIVAVRTRSGGQKFGVKLDDFIEKVKAETEKRLSSPN
ncbi:MAG: threonine--tRNA ligase [Candidatus Micrarchaeota archaeon]|nr:threonine--tRNA ligase [Candidatus Micrarchaeota archaeon]